MIRFAFIGSSQSGKTSACEFMQEFFGEQGIHDIITLKMADPIKEYEDILGVSKSRGFSQELADLTKKYYGDDIFIKTFITSDKICSEDVDDWQTLPLCEVLLSDDVRTLEEYNAVVKLGYITIFVDAPMADRIERSKANGYEIRDNHSSENGVRKLISFCDYVINNDGNNLLDLKAKCEQVFKCITF